MITYRKKIHENEWNAITKTLPLPCAETPAFKRDIESFIYSEVSNFVPKVFPVKLHWIYQCFYWTVKKLNVIFLAWKRNNDPYKVLSGGAVAQWLALEMPDRAVRARAQPVASCYWNQRQGSYADIYSWTYIIFRPGGPYWKKNVPQVWPCVPPENAGQDQYPRTLFPIWTTSNQSVHFFPTVLLCKQLLCWFWLKTLRSPGTKSDTVSRISRSEFTSDTELTFNAILGSKNELEKLLKLEI